MNEKKIIRMLLILIIIILFLGIVAMVININNRKNQKNNQESDKKEVIVSLNDDVIIPKNSYLFFGKYVQGEVDSREIYNTIYQFSKSFIPKYYSDLKDASKEEIVNYYEKNKMYINRLFKVDSSEDFVKFITELKKINSSKLALKSIEFVEGGIVKTGNSTIAKLNITYNDNDVISVNFRVYNELQENGGNLIFYY